MLDQIAKGLLGAGSKLTGMAKGLDPMSMVVDTLCGAVGLPPAVASAVKIGVGAATGNVVAAASGAMELATHALNSGPVTELGAKFGVNAEFKAGYANGGFDLSAKYKSEFSLNGGAVLPGFDLEGLVKGTLRCLLPLPFPPLFLGPPILMGPPFIFGPPIFGGGGGIDSGRPPRYNEHSHLDPQVLEYRDALHTLQQNYRTYDAAGKLDGSITDADLQSIAKNPHSSPKLKEAAQFLLNHPEYKNRVDGGGLFAPVDGTINRWDINAELSRVNFDIARYGVRPPEGKQPSPGAGEKTPPGETRPTPPPGGGGGSPGVGGPSKGIADILRDPTLSIEDKILMVLQKIMEATDEDLMSTMEELGKKGEEKAAINSAGGEDKEKKLQKNSTEMDQLQFRMQRLTEKRKQMSDLMSNISSKFNEMSKTAIQNLARA